MQDIADTADEGRMEGVYQASDDYWWSGRVTGADGRFYRFQHSDLATADTAFTSGERVSFRPEGRFARDVGRAGDRIRPFRLHALGQREEDASAAAGTSSRGPAQVPAEAEFSGTVRRSASPWWLWPLVIGIAAGIVYVYLLR